MVVAWLGGLGGLSFLCLQLRVQMVPLKTSLQLQAAG